jgi:hypothetical protein
MKRNLKNLQITIILAILTIILVISTVKARENSLFPSIKQAPSIDGTITQGEYDFNSSFSSGSFTLYWTIFNEEIYFGMIGNSLGYVALGFEPSFMMKDADMIIGWVYSNTTVKLFDTYSTGNTGPHPPDIDLGGTSDLLDYNGTENTGSTIIEFSRLLTTGDQYDFDFVAVETLNIIWAISSLDDFDSSHSARGSGQINLFQGSSIDTTPPSLWIYHVILMVTGFVTMLVGIIIMRLFKKRRWRLKAHRRINLFASLSSIAGITMSFIMVSEHFRIVHHFFGVIALPFLVFSPVFGYLFTRNLHNIPVLSRLTPYRKNLRKIHKFSGYLTFLLMLGSIITGVIHIFT